MRRFMWVLILFLFVPLIKAIDESMPDLSDIPPDAQSLVYGESILAEEWKLFFIYQDDFQVNVAWQFNRAVVISTRMEFLSSSQRSEFLEDMDSHFDVIMADYQPYTLEAECQQDDLFLYQFDANNLGVQFDVNYYVWIKDDLELWLLGLNFPHDIDAKIERTAESFHPNLFSCASEDEE